MNTRDGPVSPQQLDPQNPWPGLASYDESSWEFFSGRSMESEELLRRILDEPVTVLFGKSGLGKSSLLKAGVFPRLRDKGYLPVLVRLQIRPGAGALIDQLALALFETLRTWGVDHAPPQPGQSLWAYLHTPGREFWTKHNHMTQPVFVLDQFEELFTLGRAVLEEVAAFREALADLAENRIPATLMQRVKEIDEDEEEIDTEAMPYKIVLSLREDFLADLEDWRPIMPSLRHNRMRLLPMGTKQALQAVYNTQTAHLVTEPLARKIVDFLSRGAAHDDHASIEARALRTVEPALLSLFCLGVNEHRKQAGAQQITSEMFEGEKDTIVIAFYRRCLQVFPDRVRHFVEDKLITEHGYRNSYSTDDAIANGYVTAEELTALVDGRLLRLEQQHGTDRVELTHDILTKAALEERDRRRVEERVAAAQLQRRKMLKGVGASVLVALLFFGLGVYGLHSRDEALDAKNTAVLAREAALNAKNTAERAQKNAQENFMAASHAKADAEKKSRELAENRDQLQEKIKRLDTTRQQLQIKANEARKQTSLAEAARTLAQSKESAALAKATRNSNPELAVQHALQGLSYADTSEARSALLSAARYTWPLARLDAQQVGGRPSFVTLDPRGELLAVLVENSAFTVWDVSGPAPKKLWSSGPTIDDAMFVAFSPEPAMLAVSRPHSVDLFDAHTGQLKQSLPQSGLDDVQLAFSADGKWLASIQSNHEVTIWNVRDPNVAPTTTDVHAGKLVGIAVLHDGKTIIGVGEDSSLFATRIERMPDGTWSKTNIDFDICKGLQSVSISPAITSATMRAKVCLYEVGNDQVHQTPSEDRVIFDVFWSMRGGAFAEYVDSGDIVVGAGDPQRHRLENRVRGASARRADGDVAAISVSDDASRVAFIDSSGAVRIYSLARNKPLLSTFDQPSTVDVSPDGRWIAAARAASSTTAVQTDAVIDVIPLPAADGSPAKARQIPLPVLPRALYAVRDGIVATVSEGNRPRIYVFDPVTGENRVSPFVGNAIVLGKEGELLLQIRPDEPIEVIRLRDGATVTPKDERDSSRRSTVVTSPSRTALAFVRQPATPADRTVATVYAVRGEQLVQLGPIRDLPARAAVTIADDGRLATDPAPADQLRPVVCSVTNDTATNVRQLQIARREGMNHVTSSSPLGQFTLRIPIRTDNNDKAEIDVVRRATSAKIATLKDTEKWCFSADDRWLAVWSPTDIRVLDLTSGDAAFTLRFSDFEGVEGVAFKAHNTIMEVALHNGTMLVPIDRGLTERFARSLSTYKSSPEEPCPRNPSGAQCRLQIAESRAPATAQRALPGHGTRVSRDAPE
ncbi:hypothetical protein G3N95_09760 [Paraburkholderia sp. Tr-20389]|uniref:WD40 repeat domain-containing protein n=1 Tax=Paraburkholderia sp. Tr-20389 TaxID=2703903 RepID=UPI00197D0B49|nr:hypothetical protein [Paraburkholderia sp. Tr-20389]MBN3753230.1 hypothetical protein [Paraburkholderia sp. Tr-20389]